MVVSMVSRNQIRFAFSNAEISEIWNLGFTNRMYPRLLVCWTRHAFSLFRHVIYSYINGHVPQNLMHFMIIQNAFAVVFTTSIHTSSHRSKAAPCSRKSGTRICHWKSNAFAIFSGRRLQQQLRQQQISCYGLRWEVGMPHDTEF